MKRIEKFITVGENIHCTRILKVGGKSVGPAPDGRQSIAYGRDSKKYLPVPEVFLNSPAWKDGKVKHCSVAIWQGTYGNSDEQKAGVDYLQTMARDQAAAGADYLDVNVDEFSTDIEEKIRVMRWTVQIVQDAVKLPVSVDSSNTEILRAGLEACNRTLGRPMVNSVSLERESAIEIAARFGAVVIASAAGEKGLPCTTDERLHNLGRLMEKLSAAGLEKAAIHIDPLVLPISTDPNNGKSFLESVSAARKEYGPEVHIVAGLSNVSFGMPNRKLINQVFAWLAVEAGADGGIVDPLQINKDILNGLDTGSEAFNLAKALLMGEDEFGMNFITACREGRI